MDPLATTAAIAPAAATRFPRRQCIICAGSPVRDSARETHVRPAPALPGNRRLRHGKAPGEEAVEVNCSTPAQERGSMTLDTNDITCGWCDVPLSVEECVTYRCLQSEWAAACVESQSQDNLLEPIPTCCVGSVSRHDRPSDTSWRAVSHSAGAASDQSSSPGHPLTLAPDVDSPAAVCGPDMNGSSHHQRLRGYGRSAS